MDEPSPAELRVFLDVFWRLERFEAEQRRLRGWGAFGPEDCPSPAVQKTASWLAAMAAP